MAQNFPSKNRIKYSWVIICLFVASVGAPVPGWAAGELSVSPMMQEVVLENDKPVQTQVVITNTTSTRQVFHAATYDFGSLDESGGVAFLGANRQLQTAYSLASWLQLETDTFVLEAGEERSLSVVVRNDVSLAPGGHYGAVVFELVENVESPVPNTIAVNQMVASLLLVKKMAGAKTEMELSQFEMERQAWSLPSIRLTFRNTGNVHVVPRGIVQLTDPVGRLVAQGVVNEASAILLPETNRAYQVKPFWVRPAWLPGWYTYRINYRFDGTENFTYSTERFVLVPVRFWTICLVIGSGLLLLGWWRWRKK